MKEKEKNFKSQRYRKKSQTVSEFFKENISKKSSKSSVSRKRNTNYSHSNQKMAKFQSINRKRLRTSQNSQRGLLQEYDALHKYEQISIEGRESIQHSEEIEESPKYATHTQFAATRFRRQPQFKISVPSQSENLSQDVIKMALKESPGLLELLLGKSNRFLTLKDEDLKDERVIKVKNNNK